MIWANRRFSPATDEDNISRLIIEVKNPADPQITEFFSTKHDYVLNNNKGEQGKLSYFLTLLIIAVLTVGGLIMLPSIGLMLLSINLIVYKNQKTLGDLILLGYRRLNLSLPYSLLVLILNLIVGFLALGIVYYIQGLYIPRLEILGITGFSFHFHYTVIFAFLFIFIITVFDTLWIRRKIGKINYLHI
jgi:hypothetical protein